MIRRVHSPNFTDDATGPSELGSAKFRLPTSNWVDWLGHLRVGQKISLGYGLVLSAAVFGTAIGFMIADHYQKQAQYEEEDAIEELYQVYRLKSSVVRLRTQQHKLILYISQPDLWQQKYPQFSENVAQTRRAWSEFRTTFRNPSRRFKDTPQEKEAFEQLMETKASFDNYLKQSEALFYLRDPNQLSSEQIQALQAKMFSFMHNPQVFTLDNFLNDIARLVEVTASEYNQAKADLRQAEQLRLQIIAIGLLLSVAIASLLAICMNRMIARPIQAVTYVAQQVTEESNFDLQAPVTTHDEIGILAASLNRLIQEVQQLLETQKDMNEQLEVYSQVLEKKVQERTQELKEKNQSLQKTLQTLRLTQAQLLQTENPLPLRQILAEADETISLVELTDSSPAHLNRKLHTLIELIQLYHQHCFNSTQPMQSEIAGIDLDRLKAESPRLFILMQMLAIEFQNEASLPKS